MHKTGEDTDFLVVGVVVGKKLKWLIEVGR